MPSTETLPRVEVDEKKSATMPLPLSKFIAQRREHLKKNQAQIASQVGRFTPEWLGMIEKGHRQLDLKHVPRLADALQLDRADLAKVVIRQYWPAVYSALWPKSRVTTVTEALEGVREARKGGKDYTAQVAMDLWERIQAMPTANRVTILNLIDQMSDASATARSREG